MKTSAKGRRFIQRHEGLRLTAYDDLNPHRELKLGDHVEGTLTIGTGHTGGVHIGQTITEAEADAFLRQDLVHAERAVNQHVFVRLTQNQFDALVSFVFNVGAGAFERSTLLKRLNAGDYEAVPSELKRWTRSKGRVLSGLVKRRAAEAALFAKDISEPEPAPKADIEPTPERVEHETVMQSGSVKAGVGQAAVTTPAAGLEAVNEYADAAHSGASLVEIAMRVGPWVLLALIAVGAAFYIWQRRRRQIENAKR